MFSLGWLLLSYFTRFTLCLILFMYLYIIYLLIYVLFMSLYYYYYYHHYYYYHYCCQFRLISPRSYIVTLIPMLNKFLKQRNKQTQNLICAWKTYVVRGLGLTVDKIIIIKIWKVARTANVMFLRKFERPISGFQSEVFSFSLFLLCSLYFILTFVYH